jgi:exopolyphosphatase/guanosine-5'-triphosphate,3'-diphosphate pyrophosphatase
MISIDLGSNTLRIVEFDCRTKKRVKEFEKVVRTAHNLRKTGFICESSIQRILEALKEADKLFDFKSHQHIFAVTTEAMRRASNALAIKTLIKEKFDIDFEIISGMQEARLTLLGIEHGLKEAQINLQNYILMDLGGASTEISFVSPSEVLSQSFSFGIVSVAQTYETLENIQNSMDEVLKPFYEYLLKSDITVCEYPHFVATAGTPTSVAAFLEGIDYKSYSYEKINGKRLDIDDFTNSLNALLKLDPEEQEFWVGTNRSDLVCAGILIVKSIMQILDIKECIVIDNGLREGLAISKCNKMPIK